MYLGPAPHGDRIFYCEYQKHLYLLDAMRLYLRLQSLIICTIYYSYNTIKTEMQGGDTKKQLTPSLHMLAAAEAGLFTLVLTNPIWVVKTR